MDSERRHRQSSMAHRQHLTFSGMADLGSLYGGQQLALTQRANLCERTGLGSAILY